MKSEIKQIIEYLLLAFIISWILMFGMVLFAREADSLLIRPLSILTILGPGIAALILSLKKISLKEYLKRTFTFEQRLKYYVIFITWAVWRYFLCMLVGERVEGSSLILPLLYIPISILQGGNEEFGWRFLQPKMEKKMHSVIAALIFTVIWATWHLPFFLIPWDWRKTLFDFFVIMIGMSLTNAISLAVIYKLTNSILLCVFAHAWMNAITKTFRPSGDLKTIVGFIIEAIIGIIILTLCEKGVIKSAKERNI